MDANRFDVVSKLFANRRLSRREAMVKGGTALAATGLAAAGLSRAAAQAATRATAAGETGVTPTTSSSSPSSRAASSPRKVQTDASRSLWSRA